MKKLIIMLSCISFVFMQYNFNLINQNPNSDLYGYEIGPNSYLGAVTLYYFGHQN